MFEALEKNNGIIFGSKWLKSGYLGASKKILQTFT